MRVVTVNFASAAAVADTVLYEGYVLYPYRASAAKNQVRFQFGVVAPRAYAAAAGTDEPGAGEAVATAPSGAAEPSRTRTECLLEADPTADVGVQLRFLQIQARVVEQRSAGGGFAPVDELVVDGRRLVTWDEALPHEEDVVVTLSALLAGPRVITFIRPSGEDVEDLPGGAARVVRRRWPVSGTARLSADAIPGPYGVVRLRVDVENTSTWDAPDPVAAREDALRHSLLSAHSLVGTSDGRFISLLDPPEWARPAVGACVNRHTWPVLVGAGDVVLSAPIILYDHPEIAPESPGDLFDATEIDEILSLRTLVLTDDEKAEARATDPRAAAIIERVDSMPAEIMERLHGAVRGLRRPTPDAAEPVVFAGEAPVPGKDPSVPWWDPGVDASVSPDTDALLVAGVPVSRGSRVLLRPGRHLDSPGGARRVTDAQDLFYAGKTARVEAVYFDVDGDEYLAVSLEEVAEVDLAHGRFLYFRPSEVDPLEVLR